MAVSVGSISLFEATKLGKKGPYRHVTDSENARRIAAKQQVTGIHSPHPRTKSGGPPVKRIKK